MASTIPIDSSLNVSEEISDFFLFLLNEDRIPVPKLGLLEILAAKARPGLNAEILSSSIIARFNEIGIPTGSLEGGSANVMENLIKVICEEIVDAIQTDLRVDVAVDAGATVSASGANGGGPVAVVGATVVPHTGIGVAR